MSPQELAEKTAEATVQRTFLALGVDISTPAAVLEAQQGFSLLRTLVRARTAALMAMAALVGSGIGWAVWQAVVAAKAGG